jgi:hypothetical protein
MQMYDKMGTKCRVKKNGNKIFDDLISQYLNYPAASKYISFTCLSDFNDIKLINKITFYHGVR